MLATIFAVLLWIAGVMFTIWVLEKYFPNLPTWIRAAISALVTIALIKVFHAWVCGWLCS